MNTEILKLLRQYNHPRNWQEMAVNFHLKKAGYMGKEPVYEFFETLTDDLEVNTHSISISVQPVESYIPFHIHNYVEIMVPLAGSCTIVTKTEEFLIEQDDILIIGNRTPHQVKPIHADTVVVNLSLKDTAYSLNDLNFMLHTGNSKPISTLLFTLLSNEAYGEGRYSLFKVNHDPDIVYTIYDVIKEYYHPDIQSEQIIRFEILTLFSRLVRKFHHADLQIKTGEQHRTNLLTLLLYIEKNYASITLNEMAKHFGFNPNYLSSYLKKQTGLTFIKLVHLQRINIAAEYLVYTNAPVEQIAEKVGYENPSYFYKVFRKILHISPSEYRKQNRNDAGDDQK
ncbi:UNVERIFIED_ORG: AraC-like DNA-binding protein/mannose-6-phosphate isomerase-like protein (cupin superfamily) [Heyndrickxia coagulans]